MKQSILRFEKTKDDFYHAMIKNNHGRKIYLRVNRFDETITICDCFYIDRPMRKGHKAIPLKWKTTQCKYNDLIEVLAAEIDKRFYGVKFCKSERDLSTDEYIELASQNHSKYKFLIFIEDNGLLRTRFKNRVHRTIYLEIKKDNNKGLVQACHYCDRRYKRNSQLITPAGLNTIYFDYSIKKVLEIVNTELNCEFTDVIITYDTFGFDKDNIPICGSI